MERSLANSLRKFYKEILFREVSQMIRFYQEAEILDNVDLDYRIKSEDSCIRKYNITEKLQKQIGRNGVQLVTISRPSAYGEYEPYVIMESEEKFQERVLNL